MPKIFLSRRPLCWFLAAALVFCALFLTLYLLSERENTLLKSTQSRKYTALAAEEAEAALAAYENGSPEAEVYHRIRSAASYLSLAEPTEENRRLSEALTEASDRVLSGDTPSADTEDILRAVSGSPAYPAAITAEEQAVRTSADRFAEPEPPPETPAPWQYYPTVTHSEGLRIAEDAAGAPGVLTQASGKGFVYTCGNVYVRLSPKGGVPLEMAVFLPENPSAEPRYDREECLLSCVRFLERAMPKKLFQRTTAPDSVEETEGGWQVCYPVGGWQVQVVVRADTGRVTAMQMLPPA